MEGARNSAGEREPERAGERCSWCSWCSWIAGPVQIRRTVGLNKEHVNQVSLTKTHVHVPRSTPIAASVHKLVPPKTGACTKKHPINGMCTYTHGRVIFWRAHPRSYTCGKSLGLTYTSAAALPQCT